MPAEAEQRIAGGDFGIRGGSREKELMIGLAFPPNHIRIAPGLLRRQGRLPNRLRLRRTFGRLEQYRQIVILLFPHDARTLLNLSAPAACFKPTREPPPRVGISTPCRNSD
jgi:hypothetical protein